MKWLINRLRAFFSTGPGGVQIGSGQVTIHQYFGPPPAPEVPPEVRAMRRSVYEALRRLRESRPATHDAVMNFMRETWHTDRFMALNDDDLKRLEHHLAVLSKESEN